MKILFFIDALPAGGKERRLLELMKGLKKRDDVEFELVIMSRDLHFQEVFELGINIHFIIRKTKKDISVFSKFYHICKKFKPDIVHCWDSMSAVYLAPICKITGIKLVNGMVVDAPDKNKILNKNWLRARFVFPFSSSIIGNSFAGLKAYNVPKKKQVCIYNGFEFKRICHLPNKDFIRSQHNITSKYVVGMVASYSKFKDYKTYYSAAQIIIDKKYDVTFLAIGRDTDSENSFKMVPDKYKQQFRFIGKSSAVESLVSIMDICVLSTFTEGISNAILEYMALGKPVVATEGGGTGEIVLNNTTGFLVRPKNTEDLVLKIELLLKNDHLRYSMGDAGKKRIQHFFSIDKMVNNFVNEYYKVM